MRVPIPCSTSDFGFTTSLPVGTYDVRVERGAFANQAGVNLLAADFLGISRLVIP